MSRIVLNDIFINYFVSRNNVLQKLIQKLRKCFKLIRTAERHKLSQETNQLNVSFNGSINTMNSIKFEYTVFIANTQLLPIFKQIAKYLLKLAVLKQLK